MQSSEIRKIVRILDIVRSFHTRMHEMRVTVVGVDALIISIAAGNGLPTVVHLLAHG
jgi:hypothetical protein